jgi:multidrug efflux pump
MGNFTSFFIRRPVFSWVLNIIFVLLGMASWQNLSVRQYPRIEQPVLTIETQLPGSDASVVESQVTNLLEDALMRLPGRELIESESQVGESRIKIRFASSYNMDSAASAVNETISAVDLPNNAERPLVFRADVDSVPLMDIVITGDDLSLSQLNDYGNRLLKSQFQSVKGVGSVKFDGGGGAMKCVSPWTL